MTPQKFVLGGKSYAIPRNYVFHAENDGPGAVADISMRAMLPDLSAMTRETAHCFLNIREPCFTEVVLLGLTKGPVPATGPEQLRNLGPITHPDERIGLCGFHFLQTKGLEENAFQFFFSRLDNDSDASVIRCPKNGPRSRCVANANTQEGNSFYYNFARENLCSWTKIRGSAAELMASFRKAGETQ
ncbi:MAG TPA: hypothetical protein VG291_02080 [Xanthobacteraceae bacterium]|nr:hypothetical protein [Xanthobacteraceae bacterium]